MIKFPSCNFKAWLCIHLFLSLTFASANANEVTNDAQEECVKETETTTVPSIFSQGVKVDLSNPSYSDGVLSTTCGGVISGPNIRIQASSITYTKKTVEGESVYQVSAQGNLLIEFGDYVFAGDQLDYDFNTRTGVIYRGRTMIEPWFFGGEYVYLQSDGNYHLFNAFATTSPGEQRDWQITSETADLYDGHLLHARNVKFSLFGTPVFWLPSFKADLDSIFDSPIRYTVKWGSRQGHRVGMIYELFSWNGWKTFLRLDYRLKRGLGGGIESYYASEDRKTNFESITYVARDSSIIHPGQRFRYRFQGIGNSLLLDDKVSVHLSYDKISDIDMPTDYNDRGLRLDTAGRTELLIRRGERDWISNFITRVRINAFQTLKQELPTLETSWRPYDLARTGIVSDNTLKVAYLDFVYGNNQLYDKGYSSSRIEYSPSFYRNFKVGEINVTPEAGGVFIAYSNSPGSRETPKYLAVGKFGCNINTNFSRIYGQHKHLITPYVQYDYYTSPTVPPNSEYVLVPVEDKHKSKTAVDSQNTSESDNGTQEPAPQKFRYTLKFPNDSHYIFDIEDGWYRLDMMQVGIAQSIFRKQSNGLITRPLYANLYANVFFDTHTFAQSIPKVYGDVIFNSFSFLRHSFSTAWNFNQNLFDYYNFRTEWTVNENIALAFEYRHRSPFDWRKADRTNFILDSFRTVSQLRHSQLSDRRDTLLFHIFYRFHPCWAFQFESRSGWNRIHQPNYNEFEIDLIGSLPSALNFKLSYQHREDDDRLSVYMSIGMKRPDFSPPCGIVPFLGF